jgi:hypothetical protein
MEAGKKGSERNRRMRGHGDTVNIRGPRKFKKPRNGDRTYPVSISGGRKVG